MTDVQILLARFPGFVPVIVTPSKNIEISKVKFLFPIHENFGYCFSNIRKYIKLDDKEAVFYLVDCQLINQSQNVGDFYSQYRLNKDPKDAFIYVSVFKDNTFGIKRDKIRALAPPLWLD
jgi:hypothetical protein